MCKSGACGIVYVARDAAITQLDLHDEWERTGEDTIVSRIAQTS